MNGKDEQKNYTIYILIVLSILFVPLAYIYIVYLILRDLLGKKYEMIKYFKENNNLILISLSVLISIIFSKYTQISLLYGVMIFVCIGTISYVAANFSFESQYSRSYLTYKNGDEQFSLYAYMYEDIDISDKNSNDSRYCNIEKLLTIIYIITLISYAVGIFQMISPMYVMPKKWVDLEEYNLKKRMFSTFFNPNIFGFYINIVIIIICTRFSRNKVLENVNIHTRKFEILEKATFISSIVCLFFTFSRSSWISLILSLFIVGILFDKKYLLYSIFIFVCLFGADILLETNRGDITKLSSDSSLSYRIELWKSSFKIIKDNFIVGIGFGTLYKYTPLYSNVIKSYIAHCHNVYLQILMDTGIIGFIIFLKTFYSMTKKILKEYLLNKKNEFNIFLILVLGMIMINSLADSVSLTPQMMMILSLIIGISLKRYEVLV